MADPAVVEAQVIEGSYPPEQYEVQEKRTKRTSKKKPKASRHIELMEWLPTLPQLFAYIGFTQFLLFFWVFIGVCADDIDGTWNIVMMWITVVILTCIFFVYNFLLAKKHVIKSITATVFGLILFVFMFLLPVSASSMSTAGTAIFFFVRMLVIGIALIIYCIAYIEDLKAEGHSRTVVVETTTITNQEAQ